MNHGSNWLLTSLALFGAAVVVVPLTQALGLGSIIGYLLAGFLLGPQALGMVGDPETVLHFAEFGVVLMLFLVGLELEPHRLWALRRPIFGWGTVQVVGCTLLLTGVGVAAGAPWRWAVAGALGLALSSTAIALQVMQQRHLLGTASGQAAFSILLFQDVAAIPILALIPLLGGDDESFFDHPLNKALKAVAAVLLVILVGRLLLRHALRWVARQGTPEIFTAASLGLVIGIAALMEAVGLSMALGAFLGGVLLAESEYRRQLETDLEPFKGLLLGLFFMAVGMSVDVRALLAHPWIVAGLLLGFMAVKIATIAAMARLMKLPLLERPVFTLLLAQGGEFAFVVYQLAVGEEVFKASVGSVLVGTVALSMLVTPLLMAAVDRWIKPRLLQVERGDRPLPAELNEPQEAPILICGFGRYGQIIGRLLYANGLKPTVLDHDAEQVDALRGFGFRVHYGDSTRLDLLRIAGAGQARVIVVAVDDPEQSLKIVDLAREHFPQAELVVRARNVGHYYKLRERGITAVDREMFESSLRSGRRVLEAVGWRPHHARKMALKFREHNLSLLEQLWPHHGDQDRLVALAKQGRAQLEEVFAKERELRRETVKQRTGWEAPEDEAP